MIYQQVMLSGDAEWPKVADAVIEAVILFLDLTDIRETLLFSIVNFIYNR